MWVLFFPIRGNISILKLGLLRKRLLHRNVEQCVWRECNSKTIILPYILWFYFVVLLYPSLPNGLVSARAELCVTEGAA